MSKLPVIVGFGGINAAGRSSFHHSYRRMVIDALQTQEADETLTALAALMNLKRRSNDSLDEGLRAHILENTLIRQIIPDLFKVDRVRWNQRMTLSPTKNGTPLEFVLREQQIPEVIPEGWTITPHDEKRVKVTVQGDMDMLLPAYRKMKVQAAGQLPTGFNPEALYNSRNHPRGIQMTVFSASDAVKSVGIDWETITSLVDPDKISVYAGSGMSQLDMPANGGMIMSRMLGKKVTSKHCPFGFAEMPADFVNAYVLGSLGNTGTSMGACASFLYNVRNAITDIQTGRARVVLVGNSEAPITPEVMEGYAAMGALATDAELMALDGIESGGPNYRRACRPFSSNCGFTIAEASQFLVLMDDELAMEMGATVYGAIADVFVNADGHKKSISSPGVGNYITVAKAMAAARAIVGDEALKHRSFVQAHGTGTPQNRVTESHILNEVAKTFGIESWPVGAVKAFVGHSIGVAGGDQIVASLGVWKYGLLPGIATIDHVAEDVHDSNLNISAEHRELGSDGTDVAIINAKGFGGNNASATMLSPQFTRRMLLKKYGSDAMKKYFTANEGVHEQAMGYEDGMIAGLEKPIYKFDHNVRNENHIELNTDELRVEGFERTIDINYDNPYEDML